MSNQAEIRKCRRILDETENIGSTSPLWSKLQVTQYSTTAKGTGHQVPVMLASILHPVIRYALVLKRETYGFTLIIAHC